MKGLDHPISRAPSTGRHFATRKGQDGLKIYSLVVPLGILARDIARDFSPEVGLHGNRRVNEKHALEYADYVIERHRNKLPHITPPVVLRSSDGEVKEVGDWVEEEAQGIARGALEILPRSLRTADGQHRLYGGRKRLEWYDDEILKQKLLVEEAQANDQDAAVVDQAVQRLERLREERDALYNLPITAEIIEVESELVYQQLFADMANNQKGLGGDLTTWFDQTKVTFRIARKLTDEGGHSLLVNKVHVGVGGEDRLPADAPFWIGVKTVADIAHAVVKGVNGRFSRREEMELQHDPEQERQLTNDVTGFLDSLAEAFPAIREIRDGRPAVGGAIRKSKTTMLTSTSMLRALAGAYHLTVETDTVELRAGNPADKRAMFTAGVATLVDGMTVDPKVGLQPRNPVVRLAPSAFAFGDDSRPTAPTARMGNISALARGIAEHVQKVAS